MLAFRPLGLRKDNDVDAHAFANMVKSAKLPDQTPESVWK